MQQIMRPTVNGRYQKKVTRLLKFIMVRISHSKYFHCLKIMFTSVTSVASSSDQLRHLLNDGQHRSCHVPDSGKSGQSRCLSVGRRRRDMDPCSCLNCAPTEKNCITCGVGPLCWILFDSVCKHAVTALPAKRFATTPKQPCKVQNRASAKHDS